MLKKYLYHSFFNGSFLLVWLLNYFFSNLELFSISIYRLRFDFLRFRFYNWLFSIFFLKWRSCKVFRNKSFSQIILLIFLNRFNFLLDIAFSKLMKFIFKCQFLKLLYLFFKNIIEIVKYFKWLKYKRIFSKFSLFFCSMLNNFIRIIFNNVF